MDIELLIKIDMDTYNNFVNNNYSRIDVIAMHTALVNGTPLKKGHGRLIDADALKKDDEVTEWLSLNSIRTGKMLKSFSELFIKKIDTTPTIIEADKKGDK